MGYDIVLERMPYSIATGSLGCRRRDRPSCRHAGSASHGQVSASEPPVASMETSAILTGPWATGSWVPRSVLTAAREGGRRMGLIAAMEQRRSRLDLGGNHPRIQSRRIMVGVQGTGAWVQRTIQKELRALHTHLSSQNQRGLGLQIWYVGIDEQPPLEIIEPLEGYICKDNAKDLSHLERTELDVLIVATPDRSHVDDVKWWLARPKPPRLILVEKPFSDEACEVEGLIEKCRSLRDDKIPVPPILGIDHYNLYLAAFKSHFDEIDGYVDPISSIGFSMLEENPVEPERLRSLTAGMTFDMGAHFFGFLSLLADLQTGENLKVHISGRHDFESYRTGPYRGLRHRRYFAETYAELSLDIVLRSSMESITAYCRIGKAAGRTAKFFDFCGPNRRFVRIDRSERGRHETTSYPFGSMFFATSRRRRSAHADTTIGGFPDPVDPGSQIALDATHAPITPERRTFSLHGVLIEALSTGDYDPYGYLLTMDECVKIVSVLEDARTALLGIRVHQPGQQKWSKVWRRRFA